MRVRVHKQRGINTTKKQRDQGLRECETVAKWMAKEVLTPRTIMLIPAGRPGANYRDTIPEPRRGAATRYCFQPNVLGYCNWDSSLDRTK
jgi:hypothetical protein